MQYFYEEQYSAVKKQRDKLLTIYFITLAVYVLLSVGCIIWYRLLPYQSPKITTVKLVHYPITVLFVIYSFVFLGLPFKRVNKFYKVHRNILKGLKEKGKATFLEYDEELQEKDVVDFKSLIFIQWNEYKNKYFERKILVFYEEEFPKLEKGDEVEFVTQSNVLISYEVVGKKQIGE